MNIEPILSARAHIPGNIQEVTNIAEVLRSLADTIECGSDENKISLSANNGKIDISDLFSLINIKLNAGNIRSSIEDSTPISSLISEKAAKTELSYSYNSLSFDSENIATLIDGSINIASTTPESPTINIPVPNTNKVTDIIIQFNTSSQVPQITYKPILNGVQGLATDIDWCNISGDTMSTGTNKKYWIMIQLWINPSGSEKLYTGVMSIRELTA